MAMLLLMEVCWARSLLRNRQDSLTYLVLRDTGSSEHLEPVWPHIWAALCTVARLLVTTVC